MGFNSLSDLISEATGGSGNLGTIKQQNTPCIAKVGTLAVSGGQESLWNVGPWPQAGGWAAAIAAGANPTNTTLGGLQQANAAGGDTLHLVSGYMQATNSATNTMLLYDRLWHGAPLMSSTATQSITGSPNRYATAALAPGNFVFMEVILALSATGHLWVVKYIDDVGGHGTETATGVTGISSAAATRLNHTVAGQFFVPLNSGDNGVQGLTDFAWTASVTGSVNIVQGHPLAFLPLPAANSMVVFDGINTGFNFVRVYDNACLSMLALKGAASAATYIGQFVMVSG